MEIDFSAETRPFQPLEQLMGVFPAASMKHLPEPWRPLMFHPTSPILDFYPDDFQVHSVSLKSVSGGVAGSDCSQVDLNGKKYAWQGVALLPFVEEERLLETLSTVYSRISVAERQRNTLSYDRIFIADKHKAADFFKGILEAAGEKSGEEAEWAELQPTLLYGLSGLVRPDPGCTKPGALLVSPVVGCSDQPGNRSLGLGYKDPAFPKDHWFSAAKLPGADTPEPSLKPGDFPKGRDYRPHTGMGPRDSLPRVSSYDTLR